MIFVARDYSLADFIKAVNPVLVAPIKYLGSWAFIFFLFSIGLTTRVPNDPALLEDRFGGLASLARPAPRMGCACTMTAI